MQRPLEHWTKRRAGARRKLRLALGEGGERWTAPLIHGAWQQRSLAVLGRALTVCAPHAPAGSALRPQADRSGRRCQRRSRALSGSSPGSRIRRGPLRIGQHFPRRPVLLLHVL